MREMQASQIHKIEQLVSAVEQEAARLLSTSERVDRLGNKEGAINGYDLVIHLLDTTASKLEGFPLPDWSYMVARAMCAKADALATSELKKRAGKVYEQVVMRFAGSDNKWVQRVVGDAWQGMMMCRDGEELLD